MIAATVVPFPLFFSLFEYAQRSTIWFLHSFTQRLIVPTQLQMHLVCAMAGDVA
jgi:hypothetical protein